VIHDVDEAFFDGDVVCFECLHVWKSDEEILAEHNMILTELGKQTMTDINEVTFCPLCLHDW